MAALLAFGIASLADAAEPAVGPTPPPRPVQIDKNSVLILIRSALLAVQHANQTGNYSVLYSLSAPEFQKVNSAEKLSHAFANLRSKKFDLSGVLVLEPQLTVLPEIYANNVMRMAGFFPSVPIQVYFDLQFVPVEGQWRLIAISVDFGGSTPAAPTPNPALAASQSPTPAPTTRAATPTPTPTPGPPASVEVRPATRVTPTPKPTPKRKL